MTQATSSTALVRRVTTTMTALLTVTTLAAGCGGGDGPTTPAAATTQPATSPKAELLAAVPDGTEGAFRFTGKDATSDVSGRVDPDAKGMELLTVLKDPENGFTTKLTFLVIEKDAWMKVSFSGATAGLPRLPKGWMVLDPTKIKDPESVPTYEGTDPGNAGPLIEAATSVTEQGTGRYAGMIDLTTGEAAKVLEAEQMTTLGDAARKVPFTAVVGADGNLSSLTLDIPAAGGQKGYRLAVTYRDYGKAQKITAPTGGKAPAVAYELFNG